MHHRLCITLLATALVGVSGCATNMQHKSTDVVPRSKAEPTAADARLDDNAAYMARVEQIARRRGIQVQWVHPPRADVVANAE